MKKYIVLIIGVILLILSFAWMVFSKTSTGPFLFLASASGAIIVEGIHKVRKK